MRPLFHTKLKGNTKVEAGCILISQPFWNEEIYQRVVILIIENNVNGTTGILLNKKSNLFISDAIPSLKIKKTLYYGGNFDNKIISYVHSNSEVPDSIYLGNNLFWGGNFDVMAEMIHFHKMNLNEINFFAGFVHWKNGQLDDEINSNKWWVCELNAYELFTVPSEELWSAAWEIAGIFILCLEISQTLAPIELKKEALCSC